MGNKANITANYADNTMLGVYVAGSAYTAAEYGTFVAESLKEATRAHKAALDVFGKITPYFSPIWNYINAAGVVADAVKDYQNEDKISCYLNCVSSAQLAAGTLVGLLKAHSSLTMGLSANAAALMSSGSFAACMFFSAAVATYKYRSLNQEIMQLRSNGSKDYFAAIRSRMDKRNPSLVGRELNNPQMIRILLAEQSYQQSAITAWSACGIAMSMVAYTLHESCPMEVKIVTGVLVLTSAYLRAQLKKTEKVVENKIEKFAGDPNYIEPQPNVGFFKITTATANLSTIKGRVFKFS